jgi:DTW domain-containing protein YfiP
MKINEYRQKKAQLLTEAPKYRTLCNTCCQPDFSCYCSQLQSFDPQINFVVLIHPIEAKRRIATGRMSHLMLKNSHLIKGQDYSLNGEVNDLIGDTDYHSVILYPGTASKNLSLMFKHEKEKLFPQNKKLRIFVIDGTWATARKMIRQSENLKNLPRICFSPTKASNFRVRKQPKPNCYSTIEAIHHTIELIGESQGFDVKLRAHDQLLQAFNYMVEKQLSFIQEAALNLRTASYRRESQKKLVSAE